MSNIIQTVGDFFSNLFRSFLDLFVDPAWQDFVIVIIVIALGILIFTLIKGWIK